MRFGEDVIFGASIIAVKLGQFCVERITLLIASPVGQFSGVGRARSSGCPELIIGWYNELSVRVMIHLSNQC